MSSDQQSQEEILEDAVASLTEDDVPPDDADRYWLDPDTGCPLDLACLDGAELARRRPAAGSPPSSGGEHLSEFIPEEVAAALTLTHMAAERETQLALNLAGPLAATAAALAAGWIDPRKAELISAATATLTAAHAAAVQAAVLPDAPDLTTGQLRRALARAVLAADPDAARKQREEALKDARVDCFPDPAGTVTLAGRNLPAASVLAADKRLCRIAKAWKKQGAAGGMDLLRARAYLAQLLGLDVGSEWTVRVTAEPIAAGSCDHRNREPGYRPSPALQRIIQARSHTCTAHGCGRPARSCDEDHTVPYDETASRASAT